MNCYARFVCAGGCPYQNFQKNGDLFNPEGTLLCAINKNMLDAHIKFKINNDD